MARPALAVRVQFSRRVKCKMGEYEVGKSGAKSVNQSRLLCENGRSRRQPRAEL